jgi:hypothetical protein
MYETLTLNSTLMWLITQEDFSAFIHYESLKSYTPVNICEIGVSSSNEYQYYGLPGCATVI